MAPRHGHCRVHTTTIEEHTALSPWVGRPVAFNRRTAPGLRLVEVSDGPDLALAGGGGLGPQVQLGTVGLDLAVDGERPEGHQHQDDDLLHGEDPFAFFPRCLGWKPGARFGAIRVTVDAVVLFHASPSNRA